MRSGVVNMSTQKKTLPSNDMSYIRRGLLTNRPDGKVVYRDEEVSFVADSFAEVEKRLKSMDMRKQLGLRVVEGGLSEV
jgi:hypothetical protein